MAPFPAAWCLPRIDIGQVPVDDISDVAKEWLISSSQVSLANLHVLRMTTLSICRSINRSINQSIYLFIYYLSIHLICTFMIIYGHSNTCECVSSYFPIFHPSFPICCWTHDRPLSWASDSMFSPHLEKGGSPEKSVDVSMEISITIRDICMNICVLNIWYNEFYGCIFLGIFMGLPWLYQGFTLPLSTRIWPTPRWLHPRGIPIAGGFMENPREPTNENWGYPHFRNHPNNYPI